MKKLALAGAIGLGAAIAIYWLVLSLASHPTRLRWLLADMEDAFNRGDAGDLASGLADGFRDEESRADRAQVRLYFLGVAQSRRAADGDFALRARVTPLVDADFTIDAGAEPPSAKANVEVRFFERQRSRDGVIEERSIARVEVAAVFRLEAGDWKVHRARLRLVEGRDPF